MRFVIGPSNIQFASVYVCTFQPRHFTGCNSEGVNLVSINLGSKLRRAGPWFLGNLMLITQSVVLASDAFLFGCILIQALWDIFSLGLAAFYFHIVGFFSFNRNRAFWVCFLDTCCVRNLNCFCCIIILLFIDNYTFYSSFLSTKTGMLVRGCLKDTWSLSVSMFTFLSL